MVGLFKESIVARMGSFNDLQKIDKADDSGPHDASRAGEAIALLLIRWSASLLTLVKYIPSHYPYMAILSHHSFNFANDRAGFCSLTLLDNKKRKIRIALSVPVTIENTGFCLLQAADANQKNNLNTKNPGTNT